MDKKQIDKLLIKISQGDNNAFAQLYEGTKRGVFSFIYTYFDRYEDAEDAMQSVYLKIKMKIHQYKHGSDGRAWILQIAKNTALNDLNKHKRIVCQEEIDVKTEVKSSGWIIDIMNRVLTNDEANIVNLHVLWGYKHKEIAQKLNCPIGTVTSKYKRSIQKLKAALKEEGK